MAGLPVRLLEEVSQVEHRAADAWWAGLSDVARGELMVLLDPRADSCAFALEWDEHGAARWQPLPLSVDSELLADPEETDTDWEGSYFEYRLINPERFSLPLYEARIFHIGGLETTSAARQASSPLPDVWLARNDPLTRIAAAVRGFSWHSVSVVAAATEI